MTYTLEFMSSSPREIIYGFRKETLEDMMKEETGIAGFDWYNVLENWSDQSEIFLSGVDIDQATLVVSNKSVVIHRIKFVPEELAEISGDEVAQDNDVVGYSQDAVSYAGREIAAPDVDFIVGFGLDLKFGRFSADLALGQEFDPKKISVKVKNRDSVDEIGDLIYNGWAKNSEMSLVALYYNGEEIQFEEDYTSYPPEFFCLKRSSARWIRDKKLEQLFGSD